MKKTLLILFLTLLSQLCLAQSAQPWLEKRVSISVKNKALEEVLKGLEKDLEGMVFAYLPGSFDATKKVSVKLDSVPLREVLMQVLADQQIECSEIRGKIFLKKKKEQPRQNGGGASSKRRRRTVGGAVTVSTAENSASAADVGHKEEKKTEPPRNETKQARDVKTAQTTPETKTTSKAMSPQAASMTSEVSKVRTMDDELEERPVLLVDALPLHLPPPEPPTRLASNPQLSPVTINSVSADSLIKESFWSKVNIPNPFKKRGKGGEGTPSSTEESKSGKPSKSVEEPEPKKLRLYAASTTGITPIGDEAGIKMGGRAVWLKNSKFGIGLAGYAIQNATTLDAVFNTNHRLAGGYGGLHFEYNLNPNRFLHLSFPMMIGAGGMTYVEVNQLGNPGDRVNVDAQAVFIVEPGVMLEMNVLIYLKVGFDMNYRISSQSLLTYTTAQGGGEILESNGLNGISAGFTIKVGIF